ncbi:MAG: NADAR family protein [Gammaproteobacteria bacterium]|nr:NADAR family protein [Gammaproteobacteria bacterium]
MFNYSERRTDSHVYFVGGPFSQWYKDKNPTKYQFTQFLLTDEDYLYDFNCAEQYMMASKAKLFPCEENDVIFEAIMNSKHPDQQKELGRQVKNFDPEIWNTNARTIVFRGNIQKFKIPELFDYIMDTEDRIIVEGAIYDPVWGVKLRWNDPAIEDLANWRGTNWLGQVLMKVRKTLKEDPGHFAFGYDIDWSKEPWK